MTMFYGKKFALYCLFLMSLSGCSLYQSEAPRGATIGDIELTAEPLVKTQLPTPSVSQLVADYRELFALSSDGSIKEKIGYRLAQLVLINNEQAQEVGTPIATDAAGYYDSAIDAYNDLLKTYPESGQTEHLLYQLAKAYELQGEAQLSYNTVTELTTQFPTTAYAQELYFRSGEHSFANHEYSAAARAYHHVISGDKNSPYYYTSLYMLAWAQFKLDNKSQALEYFTQLLDISLPALATNDIDINTLPIATRQMVKDTLRVMGLIFSFQDGAQTLASHYDRVGNRYYEYLNYQNLAQWYLANKRYRDSAVTYGDFVSRYPQHQKSPHFAIKIIETYKHGHFPSLVQQHKRLFITSYGIRGPNWQHWPMTEKLALAPMLKSYVVEFSQDSYRMAQQEKNAAKKKTLYARSASWFLEYIETFNDSEEMAFLYAESLYASDQFIKAIDAYQAYAYTPVGGRKSQMPELDIRVTEGVAAEQGYQQSLAKRADAGYTALLAYNKLLTAQSSDTLLNSQERSAQLFVDSFVDDKRSITVLEWLINKLFSERRFDDAIASARLLIAWPHAISQQQNIDAQLIIADSIFNQQNYKEAASGYQAVLASIATTDKRLPDIKENYAASLYKQAEATVKSGQIRQGIALFIAVIEQTPATSIRKAAQFNAAQYLYQLKDFAQAETYLTDFRQRFKGDILVKDIAAQLISIYEQQEDWGNAAKEYQAIVNGLADKTARETPLFMAASYFEKAGNIEQARLHYRRYANAYQQPFERSVEVRFKLSETYKEQHDDAKRRFWLNKLIEAHDNAKSSATPRSTSLAAMSAMVFASDAQSAFNNIKLTLPLAKSLKRKQRSLAKVLKAYHKTSSYNVAQYTTESTFQTAQIYRQLAQDLMASARPKGLDALALEQYEILLEEQAYPFEDKAIEVFENNTQRSWQGVYDNWVKKSFEALAALMPGRYNKKEVIAGEQNYIY